MSIIEDAVEELGPEMEAWFDDRWEDQWIEDAQDRWNIDNLDLGWSLEDFKDEFDDFFREIDPSLINNGAEEQQKFELEMQKTMSMYQKGVASGKIDLESSGLQAVSDSDERQFQRLYDIAQLSANENLNQRTQEQNQVTVDEDDEGGSFLIITIVAIVILLIFAVVLVYCCYCRNKNN